MTDVVLFKKNEIDFNHEGLGILVDFTEDLEVTEGIGGFFEINFAYSLDGHLGNKIEKESYIQTSVNEQQEQPLLFRVYEIEPDYVERIVYVRARLKQLDDMMNAVHKATTLLEGGTNALVVGIQNNAYPKLSYRVGGDVRNTRKIEREDDSVFNYLFDEKGLFTLNKITPTFTPDGITIGLTRGKNNAGIITEENLINKFVVTENREDMVTAIIPFTTTKRDEIVENIEDQRKTFRETVEEKVYGNLVISPNVNQKGYPLIVRFMEFRNEVVREWEEYNRTMHEYKYSSVNDLNREASNFFVINSGVDDYFFEAKIETLGLHLDDYKELSSFGLYDEVEIYLQEYDLNVKLQVSEVTYNQALGMNTSLKFQSYSNGFTYASNYANASAPTEQQLRAQIERDRVAQIVQDYLTKDDGTNVWFRSELPPVNKSVEGDIVFIENGDGKSIWVFKDGVWVEELPLNFDKVIDDKFQEINSEVETLNSSIAESEQRIQTELAKVGTLSDNAKKASDNALTRFNEVNDQLSQVRTTAEETLRNALNVVNRADGIASDSQALLNQVNLAKQEAMRLLEQNGVVAGDLTVYKQQVANFMKGYVRESTFNTETQRLNNRVNEWEQTVDGVRSSISEVEMKIPTSFENRNYFPDENITRSSTRLITIPVGNVLAHEVGNNWTISFKLRIKEDGIVRPLIFYHYQSHGIALELRKTLITTKEWETYSFTGTVVDRFNSAGDSPGMMAILDQSGPNSYEIKDIKLEPGNIATPYSEYYLKGNQDLIQFKNETERTSKQVTDRLTALDGTNGKINEILRNANQVTDRLTALDGTNGKINELIRTADGLRQSLSAKTELSTVQNLIKASADGITTELSRVENKIPTSLGGRNYLLKRAIDEDFFGSNNSSVTPLLRGEDNIGKYIQQYSTTSNAFQVNAYVRSILLEGNIYGTYVSNDLKNYSGKLTYSVEVMSSQPLEITMGISADWGSRVRLQPNVWTKLSSTRDFGGRAPGLFSLDAERLPKDHKLYWRNYKIEKGTIATDYSPALEDNVSKSEFHTINEKVNFYERLIGTSTNDATAKANLARILMTDSLYQTEVQRQETNVDILARVSDGVSILNDPTFDTGLNDLNVYNNSNNGTVTIDRQTNVGSTQPNGKPNRLRVSHTGTASPYFGGIRYAKSFSPNPNSVFVVDFVALLPAGRSFSLHNNALGTGGSVRWVTSNEGNGTWRRYVGVYTLGKYSIGQQPFAFIAVKDGTTPTTNNPLVWYIQSFDIKNITQSGSQVLSTKVTQLADSWAVKALNSNGDILAQLNQTNGLTKIQNKLIELDGTVTMTDAFVRKLMVDTASVNTLTALAARFGSIVSAYIDAGRITTGQLTGINIRGGVLSAINGAVDFNLNNGELLFKTNNPAIKRTVPGYPNQMVKFETNQFTTNNNQNVWMDAASTIIGSNRYFNDYAVDNNFTGIRIINAAPKATNSDHYIDRVELIGDRIVLTHTGDFFAKQSRLIFVTNITGGVNYIYPENLHDTKQDLGTPGYPFNNLIARNMLLSTPLNPNQDLVEILMSLRWHIEMVFDRFGMDKSKLFRKLK